MSGQKSSKDRLVTPTVAVSNDTAKGISLQPPVMQEKSLEEDPASAMQLKSLEEEEHFPVQGKFVAQRIALPEEEVPVQGKFTTQFKANDTGMPDHIKNGVEQLSGMDLSGVKVHYNSDKPAQLNAHAYAQGNDIHLGAGQEKHLPHEAWHVVQQRQGRVPVTRQMKQGVPVNDDAGLENEADVMGARALQMVSAGNKEEEESNKAASAAMQR